MPDSSLSGKVAIVGVDESDRIGVVPDKSMLQLHAEGARNALKDAGLTLKDVDGLFTANISPAEVGEYQEPYGLPRPAGSYALAASRHMAQYGTTKEQLAEIAVATRKWAGLNPKAMYRDPITVEDVLSSRMICWPFNLLDCCLVTDAGGGGRVDH